MFDHPFFDRYEFDQVPRRRDLYLMDEKYMAEYERSLLRVFEGARYNAVGTVSFASVHDIRPDSFDLAWFTDVFSRFHEVRVALPRSEFVRCVASDRYDEKPHIFVRGAWLQSLYIRSYSIFGLIDADGVTKARVRNT